jgi:hypothetical protein
MPWFKVDDKFTANQKVTRIPRAKRWSAIGLWTLAGAWSADQLTDGFVPQHQFDEMGARQEDAEQLCLAHLWSAVEGGFQFNNWVKYQPSAAEVSEKLERLKVTRSIVGKKGAAARWGKPDGKMANEWQDKMPTASTQRLALAIPVPSRPDPTVKSDGHGKRMSEDFSITNSMREWFANQQLTVDIESETSKFVDYYLSQPGERGIRADWAATWRSWMKKSQEFRKVTADVDPWAGKRHLGFDGIERMGGPDGPVIVKSHRTSQSADESNNIERKETE